VGAGCKENPKCSGGRIVNHPNRGNISAEKWPEYVKRFRDQHNLTQQQLADKLPTSLRRIEAFEQGESVPPQYLKRALRDLGCELTSIVQR
jgi:ribosome-binding protein aMBF1 (putative translation factor)